MIRHTFTISCDKSGEDDITCLELGAPTIKSAEEMAARNGWISGDGYHECPRHKGGTVDRFTAPRSQT